jgi:hypothetical protein
MNHVHRVVPRAYDDAQVDPGIHLSGSELHAGSVYQPNYIIGSPPHNRHLYPFRPYKVSTPQTRRCCLYTTLLIVLRRIVLIAEWHFDGMWYTTRLGKEKDKADRETGRYQAKLKSAPLLTQSVTTAVRRSLSLDYSRCW